MPSVRRLLGLIKPYQRLAVASLLLLAVLVGFDLAIPRLVQHIIDHGILAHDRGVVLRTALLMLGISLVSVFVAIGNNVYSVRAGEGAARDLRELVFAKIQSFSFGNLDRHKTGELLVRLTSDVAAVKSLIQISLRIGTRAPLMMVGSLILMVSTSPELALTMLPLLLVTSVLIVFFVLKMEPLFRSVQLRLDGLNNVLQENIAGARLVKSLVRGELEESRFSSANAQMTDRAVQVMKFSSVMMPVLTVCINVGMVIVVWSGGLEAIRGQLSLGQIVAFSNYLLSTMTPLVMMTMLSNMWAAGLVSIRRIEDVLADQADVQDPAKPSELPAGVPPVVSFEDVSFGYHGPGDEAVLRGIDLSARAGQTVAILGATGSGKSTLVSLIPRFYEVTSGRVAFCGLDVRQVTQEALLRKIAFVPQESILFSGSVRDNIRYGKPGASDAEVEAAARAAQAHEFIAASADGYDRHVEARGGNFSGGQKQRLCIARALLVDPEVLILDDSTSAVDVETEILIQEALERGKAKRITFVVAQRISTVLKADSILVLEKGQIVARGTHRELLVSSEIYREIYDSQLGRGPDERVEFAAHGVPS